MEIHDRELDNGIRIIGLTGKLDIVGVGEIETHFAALCGGENPRLAVDLSEVGFLASIGIRLLTLTAKSVASRGGRMVLLSPGTDVLHVLDVTGIPAIIPVCSTLESAEALLLGP